MALSESDTRAKLIDPAIHARGWTEDLIKREESAGAIYIMAGKARKQPKGRVDYTLRVRVEGGAQPLAVALIEAKAERLPPTHGLQKAKLYAASQRLNVPFVFSSNGHLFVEYDSATGLTSPARSIARFPTPDELAGRYEKIRGFRLTDDAAKPLLVPYKGGESVRRYYQDAAIRAVVEKIARCARTGEPKRALLALAAGSGKTRIAVHLLRKIADAGQLRRALFVCDRDELRNQALNWFQGVFGGDAAPVSGGNPQKNARVLIATYQTLDVDTDEADANFLLANYPENYFSHIIIDECHRSAWGKWSQVLRRNPDAVQVGLTATPRKLQAREKSREAEQDRKITADNIAYFGEPVYEYDMSQAMEDGYLALCEIQKGRADLDETGITIDDVMAHNPRNALTGKPMTRDELRELYEKMDFEDRIMLPDRVMAMTADLFRYLAETGGPEQKTIIFCVTDRHADDVANAISNLYAEWCRRNGRNRVRDYAFKCTAAASGGDFVPDLRGSSTHHFVATTVELLTTGVDIPCLRNIVFFRYLRSPISLHQMVGRGSRLDPATGKLSFTVYDYTDATRLFGKEFVTKPRKPRKGGEAPPPEPIVVVEGFEVHVGEAGRYVVASVDGEAKAITIEEYRERLARALVEEAKTLEDFRSAWVEPERRGALIGRLPDGGRAPAVVQAAEDRAKYDLYDVLADIGYGLAPRTRSDRAWAFGYKNRPWLDGMPAAAAAAIRAIASQFAKGGTEALETPFIFDAPEVRASGGLESLQRAGEPAELVKETKARMFTV